VFLSQLDRPLLVFRSFAAALSRRDDAVERKRVLSPARRMGTVDIGSPQADIAVHILVPDRFGVAINEHAVELLEMAGPAGFESGGRSRTHQVLPLTFQLQRELPRLFQ
jgi:hypothetical protein